MSTVGISYQEVNFNGLRRKPSYEELVRYIQTDKDKIKYPDRRASFIRKHPYLTQLDGETMATMEQQQLEAIKELQKINNLNMFAMEHGITRVEAMGIMDAMPADPEEFIRRPYPPPPPSQTPPVTGFTRRQGLARSVGSAIGSAIGTAGGSFMGVASSVASGVGAAASSSSGAISQLVRRGLGTAAEVHAGEMARAPQEFYIGEGGGEYVTPRSGYATPRSAPEQLQAAAEAEEFARQEIEVQRRARAALAVRDSLQELQPQDPVAEQIASMQQVALLPQLRREAQLSQSVLTFGVPGLGSSAPQLTSGRTPLPRFTSGALPPLPQRLSSGVPPPRLTSGIPPPPGRPRGGITQLQGYPQPIALQDREYPASSSSQPLALEDRRGSTASIGSVGSTTIGSAAASSVPATRTLRIPRDVKYMTIPELEVALQDIAELTDEDINLAIQHTMQGPPRLSRRDAMRRVIYNMKRTYNIGFIIRQ